MIARSVHFGLIRLRRVLKLLDALAVGVSLGIMSRRQVEELDRLYYDAHPRYLDDDHNTSGLFVWEREAVDAHFDGCRRVAVIGAGGGREVLALAEEAREVVGYECNPHLVRFANELLAGHGGRAVVEHLAADRGPPPDSRFDGVIVGWTAYMLIPGRSRRIAFLKEVAAVLDEGSPVLVSFWDRRPASSRHRWIARAGTAVRRGLRRERVEQGDDLQPNYMHFFTEPELAAEMDEAGFRLVRFEPRGAAATSSAWAVGIRAAATPA